MVSSRATEYISRFSKGVQKKTALKKIIEYRDECKGLYHQAESKNPMNYRAAEDKREYLEDMLARIHCLGEARDHLEKEINKAPSKAKNNMRSAVAFKPEEENKPKSKTTKSKYFQRTETDLRKLGYEDANVVKYILRFQGLGLADNYAYPCQEAAEEYQEKWCNSTDANQHDEEYCDQAEIAVEALGQVITYFEDLQETINTEGHDDTYVYNARNDEYVLKSECY